MSENDQANVWAVPSEVNDSTPASRRGLFAWRVTCFLNGAVLIVVGNVAHSAHWLTVCGGAVIGLGVAGARMARLVRAKDERPRGRHQA